MGPVRERHEGEPVVYRSVVSAYVKDLLEEPSEVSGGVKVVQRVPVVVTFKSGLCDRKISEGIWAEVVASVALPNLV